MSSPPNPRKLDVLGSDGARIRQPPDTNSADDTQWRNLRRVFIWTTVRCGAVYTFFFVPRSDPSSESQPPVAAESTASYYSFARCVSVSLPSVARVVSSAATSIRSAGLQVVRWAGGCFGHAEQRTMKRRLAVPVQVKLDFRLININK